MALRLLLVWAAALSAVGLVAAQNLPDCSKPFPITDPATGTVYNYDLSAATAATAAQLIAGAESPNSWTMFVNICGDASLPGIGNVQCDPTPVCQVDNGVAFDCGGTGPGNWRVMPYYELANPSQKIYDGGVVVLAQGGGMCGNVQRSTTLFLKCDRTVTTLPQYGAGPCKTPGQGTCQTVSEGSMCVYSFPPIAWAGFCPGGLNGSNSNEFDMGWVFVIIVLCGLFLYFVLGFVILKFAMHKEGREVVPHVEFWAALPGLVWDGIKFSWRKITCQTEGYTEV